MNARHIIATAVGLLSLASAAQAAIVSGNFNSAGYDVLSVHVAAPATVDFRYLSGYGDPTISLFNSAGAHLISNDDSNSLYFHLTRTLAAGNYSVLVSYCCSFGGALSNTTYSSSDGFNSGSYWIGGTGSLDGMKAYLDANAYAFASGASYSLDMRNAALGSAVLANTANSNDVPEPSSFALAGLALLGLGLARRRA